MVKNKIVLGYFIFIIYSVFFFAIAFGGKAPPCSDPGVCGPYSECLEVENLKSMRRVDELEQLNLTTITLSKALRKIGYTTKDDNRRNNTENDKQTVLCACKPYHIGAPPKCRPYSCSNNDDCPPQFSCVNGQCKDPCQGICGQGAECKVVNHFPVCRCLKGFTGDPFFNCKAATCQDNDECPPDLQCRYSKCRDPCLENENAKCGANAKCSVTRHSPTCVCVPGYTGDPFKSCSAIIEDEIAARCNLDVDCDPDKACVNGYCRDPCVGYCKGLWKKCIVFQHKPRCRCEINTFYSEDDDNCQLNSGSYCGRDPVQVCGQNSQCIESTIGPICRCRKTLRYVGLPPNCKACAEDSECLNKDHVCSSGRCVSSCTTKHCATNGVCIVENGAPECKCLTGYTGDGIKSCEKIKTPDNLPACQNDTECGEKESCTNGKCQNACSGVCGYHSECIVKSHIPTCICPAGFTGDAYYNCQKLPVLAPFEADECESDTECPDYMSCGLHKSCVSPCNQVCAMHTGAKCEAKRHRATCWCPNVGQPWKRCYSTEESGNSTTAQDHPGPYSLIKRKKVNPCNPSPCGTLSSCTVSRGRAVCHCLSGYSGIPPACTPQCFKDYDCPENMACLNGICNDPCHSKCSRNEYTFCMVVKHRPTCVDASNPNLLLRTVAK